VLLDAGVQLPDTVDTAYIALTEFEYDIRMVEIQKAPVVVIEKLQIAQVLLARHAATITGVLRARRETRQGKPGSRSQCRSP
jgi:hypothetical protein